MEVTLYALCVNVAPSTRRYNTEALIEAKLEDEMIIDDVSIAYPINNPSPYPIVDVFISLNKVALCHL